MQATVKHGRGKVMVWGCMSSNGIGELVFIDEYMDKLKYLQILKENLKKSAENMGILDTYKFYQDNDPKHTAYDVRLWCLYNCPKVVNPPPQSPDLNPIENLWDELEKNVQKSPIHSKPQLKERLQEEWAKISQLYLSKLEQSVPRRLLEVLQRKGRSTKY